MSISNTHFDTNCTNGTDNTKDGIHFSPYRVSTITCNANIGKDINLNLKMLFENILIIDKDDTGGIVWAQYMKDGEDLNRGIYPKKRRNSKKNKMKKIDLIIKLLLYIRMTNICLM